MLLLLSPDSDICPCRHLLLAVVLHGVDLPVTVGTEPDTTARPPIVSLLY